jgi:hypothetical protein
MGSAGLWTTRGVGAGGAGLNDAGTPLVLFDGAARALVLSQLSPNNLVAQLAFAPAVGDALGAGLGGMVAQVPAGWAVEFLLVAGQGINDTVLAWGNQLLARGGKPRTPHGADLVTSTLGWWTDNGAYFYYNALPHLDMGGTTLAVLDSWRELGLPVRHIMYDSWWYFKECESGKPDSWLSCKGALELWEPRPDVFAQGFAFRPPLPTALHSRVFSATNNTYALSLGFADSFVVDSGISMPVRSDVFLYLMRRAQESWGMVLYEQDHLVEFAGMRVSKSNISAQSLMLEAMAAAADELGVTLQYCMALPKHMLESTRFRAVTNSRASSDYNQGKDFHPGYHNYDVSKTSLLYWALGVIPSKDE